MRSERTSLTATSGSVRIAAYIVSRPAPSSAAPGDPDQIADRAAQAASPHAPASVSASQRSGRRFAPPHTTSVSSITRMNRVGGPHWATSNAPAYAVARSSRASTRTVGANTTQIEVLSPPSSDL
jgi:hypothetical protein